MGAAVRVEAAAFSDERYTTLARLAGLADADHARGKMLRIWRQCTDQGSYTLSPAIIESVLGPNGTHALIESGLGSPVRKRGEKQGVHEPIRIHGTKHRVEWLDKLRKNGSLGGRARAKQKVSLFQAHEEKEKEKIFPDTPSPDLVVPELPDPSGAESRIERIGGRGRARDAGMRVPAPPAVESPERGRAGVPADPRHEETKRLLRELVPLHAKVFNAMREELSAKVPAMAAVGDPAERALLELIRAQPSLVDFELRARHAIAVAEAEARSSGSVRYLGASVWREQSFAFAMQTAVGEGRGKKQRSAFDVLDEMEKEMDS